MDLQNYIGYPVEIVKKDLDSKNIKYKIKESSEIQKKFDSILVVKISQCNDIVEIITDKFLLNI